MKRIHCCSCVDQVINHAHTADDGTHCTNETERTTKTIIGELNLYKKSSSDCFVLLCTIHVLCLWATDSRQLIQLYTMFKLWNGLNMGSSDKMAHTNTNLTKRRFCGICRFLCIFYTLKSFSVHFKGLLQKMLPRIQFETLKLFSMVLSTCTIQTT